jgi:hypothetical protein
MLLSCFDGISMPTAPVMLPTTLIIRGTTTI